MEKIELKNIKLSDNRIEYEYFISDGLLKYFKNPLNKYIMEYKLNGEKYCLDNIPESVLSIPFVCNMLPLIWLTDSKLCVKCLDKDFYNCITDLKNGYIEMYPKAIFAGYVEIIDVETNINQKERSGLFFSGGLDAYTSLVRNLKDKPYLVSIWGADISSNNEKGWSSLQRYLNEASENFDLPLIAIRSSFRDIFNENILDNDFKEILQDLWWHAVQHGIAIIGHAAPVAYKFNFKTQYIASSYSINDQNVRCASYPTLDNKIKYVGCSIYHDGFELTRLEKVKYLDSFCKDRNRKVNIHVCWQNAEGKNCCMCEKCWRTMAEFLSQGIDPIDYGFNYNIYSLKFMKRYLELEYDFNDITRIFWINIQKEFIVNKKIIERFKYYDRIKWIETFDFYRANNSLKRKLYRCVSRIISFF